MRIPSYTHYTFLGKDAPRFKMFSSVPIFLVLHICITNHKVRIIDDIQCAELLHLSYTGKEIQRSHTFIYSKLIYVALDNIWGA